MKNSLPTWVSNTTTNVLRTTLSLAIAAGVSFNNPVYAAASSASSSPYSVSSSTSTVKRRLTPRHKLRAIRKKATRIIEKYGTPNPNVHAPSPSPMPTPPPTVPKVEKPVPPPAYAKPLPLSERFLRGAAKVMTTSWNGNIFVWLPAISTDPNAGPTYGILPVLVLSDPASHHIRHLLAPSYTYNSLFGQTGTGRYYFYPTDSSQLFLTGSVSEHVNKEIKGRFVDSEFLGGRAFIFGEGQRTTDGSMRFFGIGPSSRSSDEAGYTMTQTAARFAMGVNFLHNWRASAGARYRRVEIGDNIVPNISDLRTRYPGLTGIAAQNTVAGEARILWDTRDYPVTPTKGSSGEFFLEKTNSALGSDSDFFRYGGEGKRFFPWSHPDHVTVIHGLFERVDAHQIPFYELPSLGGRETLRAYGDGRMADNSRLLFNIEHRITLTSLSMMGVQTKFEVAPFFDVGAVSSKFSVVRRRDFRTVYGAAFRAVVTPNVVGAVDVGIGKDGPGVFVGINYPF